VQAELHTTPWGQLTEVSSAHSVLVIAAESKVSGLGVKEPQYCVEWQPEGHRLDRGKEWFERIGRNNALYNFIIDTVCPLRNQSMITLPIWLSYISDNI
jgi:hypothetical protein